jgi:glycine cleavage system aminomethyltransferase T
LRSKPPTATRPATSPSADCHRIVGHIAAGGYGHVVGQSIELAYLAAALAGANTRLEVEILGGRRPATVVDAAVYDPANGLAGQRRSGRMTIRPVHRPCMQRPRRIAR